MTIACAASISGRSASASPRSSAVTPQTMSVVRVSAPARAGVPSSTQHARLRTARIRGMRARALWARRAGSWNDSGTVPPCGARRTHRVGGCAPLYGSAASASRAVRLVEARLRIGRSERGRSWGSLTCALQTDGIVCSLLWAVSRKCGTRAVLHRLAHLRSTLSPVSFRQRYGRMVGKPLRLT